MKSVKLHSALVETIAVIFFLALITSLIFIQKNNFDAMFRDNTRKTAINAMHYALENSYYKARGYYPEQISAENLTVVDPDLWTDPSGHVLGEYGCDYVYTPGDCVDGRCSEYVLSSRLEKEDTYIKTND